MNYKNLQVHIEDRTAIIRIDRQAQMNALNFETIAELKQLLGQLDKDSQVFGLIITGAGEKAFVAGADIKEFQGKSKKEATALSKHGHELMDILANYSKPVIAAINGFALGGGLELALACHMRFASASAKMGLPEVSLGLIPGYGGTQRLRDLVGKGMAMEMILTGDMIDAEQACRCGLINRVVEPEQLLATARQILEKSYTRSRSAIKSAIAAVNVRESHDQDGLLFEMNAFGACFETADFTEGVQAFLEKRKPNF